MRSVMSRGEKVVTELATTTVVAPGVQFGVLGAVEASVHDEPVDIGGPKQRAVLAVLIAHAGRRVSTDTIIEEVYGQDASSGARRSVQTFVANLRRELGDAISSEKDGYQLRVARDAIDANRFEDLVEEGRNAIESDAAMAAATLRSALALWRGNPYAGIDHRDILYPERTRLLELRLSATGARVEADLALGRHQELIGELEALANENPYREQFRALHMLALYRSGRQSEALRAYQQTRNALIEELGIEPSPELRALEQKILEQDASIAYAGGPSVKRRAMLVVDVDTQHLTGSVSADDHVSLLHEADTIVTDVIHHHTGTVFAQRMNASFVAFDGLDTALHAAEDIARSIHAITGEEANGLARSAVDIGDVEVAGGGELTGPVVTRVAGLIGLANPGQILISAAAQAHLESAGGWTVRGLGDHRVPYVDEPQAIYQLVVDGVGNDFPSLRSEAAAPPVPGGIRAMPGYELRREVERGPGWIVWQAYQPSVGREVAVRIVSPETSNEPAFVRRFEVDALSVARLDHPNIVPLYDYWRDLSGAYLVSRWLSGRRLAAEIELDRLRDNDTDRLVENLGAALSAAHNIGIIHGAISPKYVFRDGAGSFLLANFGIGRGVAGPTADNGAAAIRADISDLLDTIEAAATPTARVAGFLGAARAAGSIEEVLDIWRAGSPTTTDRADLRTEARNPYRGLSAFTAAHANDFFGRDRAVDQLVEEMEDRRFVAIVGPSGVGKSSLLQAGLQPALANGALPGSEEWFTVSMTPGTHPQESLVSALLRSGTQALPDLDGEVARDNRGIIRALSRMFPHGSHVVLLIDQFEELFTMTADRDLRNTFLESLATLIEDGGTNAHVIIAMRADFFDEPLLHPTLGDLLQRSTIPLSAPTAEELYEIIEAPAARVGVGYETGLIANIIADVETEPGRLPLLGYALREMFEQRSSDVIRLADYEAVGGVLGALGRRAEEITNELGDPLIATIKQVFLRLVTVGDSGRPTRRRALVSELYRLDDDRPAVSHVVSAFTEHRLLIVDRDAVTRSPTVDVAHEALFKRWPRLAAWIDEQHDDLALRRRLLIAAEDWETSDRSEEMLLGLGSLVRYEEWAQRTDLSIGPLEEAFVTASRQKLDDVARRQSNRRRLVFATISAIAAVALALAVVANRTADRARTLAADALIGDAQFQIASGQFEEAALGLVESFALDDTQNAYTAMSQIINGAEIWGTSVADAEGTTAVKVAVDWERDVVAVAGANGIVPLLDADDGMRLGEITSTSPITVVAFLSDGRLVTGDQDGGIMAWDVATSEQVGNEYDAGIEITALITTSDDRVIFATEARDSGVGAVKVVELGSDGAWRELANIDLTPVWAQQDGRQANVVVRGLALSSDEATLVTVGDPNLTATWELDSGNPVAHLYDGGRGVWSAIYSIDGAHLITGQQDRTLMVRDATTLEPIGQPSAPISGQQRSLSFTRDGRTLVTSGQSGVLLWEFADGSLGTTPTVVGETASITTHGHVMSPDGEEVIAGVTDRVRRYVITPGGTTQPEWQNRGLWDVETDGTTIHASGIGGGVYSWNTATGEIAQHQFEGTIPAIAHADTEGALFYGEDSGALGRIDGSGVAVLDSHDRQVWTIEWSPDRRWIATSSADNKVAIRDPSTLEVVRLFGPDTPGGPRGLKTLAFVDDTRLATAGEDGMLRLWDFMQREEIWATPIVDNQTNAIAVLDDATLAVGDETGSISVVDIATGEIVSVIEAHTAAVRTLALSPDGTTLASGSQDNSVRLWAVDTWHQVGLMRHPGAVRALTFFDEGRQIVAVDNNGNLIIWDSDWRSWPERLCGWLDGWDLEASWQLVMGEEEFKPTCAAQ